MGANPLILQSDKLCDSDWGMTCKVIKLAITSWKTCKITKIVLWRFCSHNYGKQWLSQPFLLTNVMNGNTSEFNNMMSWHRDHCYDTLKATTIFCQIAKKNFNLGWVFPCIMSSCEYLANLPRHWFFTQYKNHSLYKVNLFIFC